MEIFTITSAAKHGTTDWPAWLQASWEREWGAKSAFEPLIGAKGVYVARDSSGNERTFRLGQVITPAEFY